ncbi:signal peptide peptidase SppA [Maricaulaceae bacterium MS644]
MKQFWSSFLGTITGLLVATLLMALFAVFAVGGLIASAVQSADDAQSASLPTGAIILELDLREPRTDQPSMSPFAFTTALPHTDLLIALERARGDARVEAVFVRANALSMAPGRAEEIRGALNALSAAGKRVVVHAQGFEGPAVANYFAVAGADTLWLQDSASFSATGYTSETIFFGDAIEQAGARAEFMQFYEYKNAADPFLSADYTEAHREATLSWLGSLFDTAIDAAAADRGMAPEAMRALIEAGPYSAEAALESGLVDSLGHVHEAREAARGDSRTARFVQAAVYHRAGAAGSGPVIALIGAEGAIETGNGDTGFGGAVIGSDRMSRAIDSAARDSSVRAIILRVDSPGGSAIASDQIWDAVVRAREAGKPVVVSMGSVAASGGYYIAAPADRIVANASTLTGSIGVVAGKIVVDGALQRLGVNIEPLSVGGEFTTAFSSATVWSESQRAAYERLAEDVYADFTEKVAEGRDLPLSRVRELARGRVWTGAQALDHGLVDRIGGFQAAVEEARGLAGLAADEPSRLRRYPSQLTPLEAFQQLFGVTADGAEAAVRLNALLDLPEVRAALRERERLAAPGVRLESADAERAAEPDQGR